MITTVTTIAVAVYLTIKGSCKYHVVVAMLNLDEYETATVSNTVATRPPTIAEAMTSGLFVF